MARPKIKPAKRLRRQIMRKNGTVTRWVDPPPEPAPQRRLSSEELFQLWMDEPVRGPNERALRVAWFDARCYERRIERKRMAEAEEKTLRKTKYFVEQMRIPLGERPSVVFHMGYYAMPVLLGLATMRQIRGWKCTQRR